MNEWNGFDFLIFLVFALNTLLGMQRGASREIISMMCLSLALIFSIKFTVPLAAFCNRSPLMIDVVSSQFVQNFMSAIGAGELTESMLMQTFYGISLAICFVGSFSIFESVLSVTGATEHFSFPYATLNRKVGGSLGAVRGYVISLVIISICTLHVFRDSGSPFFTNSFFVNLFRSSAVNFDSIISGQKPEEYNKIFKDKNLYNAPAVLEELAKPAVSGLLPATPAPADAAPANQSPGNQGNGNQGNGNQGNGNQGNGNQGNGNSAPAALTPNYN